MKDGPPLTTPPLRVLPPRPAPFLPSPAAGQVAVTTHSTAPSFTREPSFDDDEEYDDDDDDFFRVLSADDDPLPGFPLRGDDPLEAVAAAATVGTVLEPESEEHCRTMPVEGQDPAAVSAISAHAVAAVALAPSRWWTSKHESCTPADA